MKVFTTSQIHQLDQYTIEHEPIFSIDLMERAADALLAAVIGLYPLKSTPFCVFAGPGNNGGDALALARKLIDADYPVQVYLCTTGELSPDCATNKTRIVEIYPTAFTVDFNQFDPPSVDEETVIIDGLFGSGLSRPLSGIFAAAVDYMNDINNTVIAIDIPSGLNGDMLHLSTETCVRANYTLSLQFPKIAFFFAENDVFIGRWLVLDIGLHPTAINEMLSVHHYMKIEDMQLIHKKRLKFTHKGTFGHLALLAGSKGMAGAAVLAARAALRSGVGLLTLHGPEGNRCIIQTIAPEVMYEADQNADCISEFYHADHYDVLAIGPGIGTRTVTVDLLHELLKQLKYPCVLDADALNIIASEKSMLSLIPVGSILTPHPKEFERLSGKRGNSLQQIEQAQEMAIKYQLYIVLKGANTKIVTPEGMVFFNSTGNPGMATAGSGDVLTGILGGLLAQGYVPEQAAKLGVFLHGLSADLALATESEESLMAGDIIINLGKAFKQLSAVSSSLKF